jgi:glycosyltransferase involved in cell wall biosynthesis
MIGLTVIILTQDEAADLPACAAPLTGWARIVVVDSGSRDNTVAIAKAAGAEVYEHPFASFGEQRNWALDHCGVLPGTWVLFLDADEVATPAFRAAVEQQMAAAGPGAAGGAATHFQSGSSGCCARAARVSSTAATAKRRGRSRVRSVMCANLICTTPSARAGVNGCASTTIMPPWKPPTAWRAARPGTISWPATLPGAIALSSRW